MAGAVLIKSPTIGAMIPEMAYVLDRMEQRLGEQITVTWVLTKRDIGATARSADHFTGHNWGPKYFERRIDDYNVKMFRDVQQLPDDRVLIPYEDLLRNWEWCARKIVDKVPELSVPEE